MVQETPFQFIKRYEEAVKKQEPLPTAPINVPPAQSSAPAKTTGGGGYYNLPGQTPIETKSTYVGQGKETVPFPSGGTGGSTVSKTGNIVIPQKTVPLQEYPTWTPPKQETVTIQQLHQQASDINKEIGLGINVLQSQKIQLEQQAKEIVLSSKYILTTEKGRTFTVPGYAAKKYITLKAKTVGFLEKKMQTEYQKSQKFFQETGNLVTEWHPSTKIVYTEGYEPEVLFPFAGAEHYYSYKKKLESDPFGAMLTGLWGGSLFNVDVAYYKATGQTEKALSIQMRQMGSVASTKEAGGILSLEFAKNWFSSPITQLGMAAVGGQLFGAGLGKATGYFTQMGNIGAIKTINIGSAMLGGSLGVMGGLKVYSSYQKGDIGEALGEANLFAGVIGVSAITAQKGYAKGYIAGSKKGYTKYLTSELSKGNIESELYKQALNAMSSGKYLEKTMNPFKIKQPSPDFKTVEALKMKTPERIYLENKLVDVKHEIFGGLGSKKVSTHDIDVMVSGRTNAYIRASSKILKQGPTEGFADVKPFQRVGEVAGEFTIKQSPIKTVGEKVYTEMRWQEQFSRLRGSSLRPPKVGRLKDIPESVRMLDQIYTGKQVTPETLKQISIYKESMAYMESLGEKNPLISSKARYESLYGGTSLKEKVFQWSSKFWEEITPQSKFRADVYKYTKPVSGKTIRGESYLQLSSPKYSSMGFSSSLFGGISSSLLSSLSMKSVYISPKYKSSYYKPVSSVYYKPLSSSIYYPSISKYFGVSPSISPSTSKYISLSVSPSVSKYVSPSISKSPSISPSIGKYPSSSLYSSRYYSKSPSTSPSISKTPSLYPKINISGRGKPYSDYDLWGEKKKFRHRRIMNPLQTLFSRSKIKI